MSSWRAAAFSLLFASACGGRVDTLAPPADDGGPCADGILATDGDGASALALDGDELFWGTVDGEVRWRSATLASEGAVIQSIAVDGEFVYYAVRDRIRRIPRAGGAPEDFFVKAGSMPWALVFSSHPTLGAHALYWEDYMGAGYVTGTDVAQPLAVFDGVLEPTGFAVDDGAVYVATQDRIRRVDKATLEATTIVDELSFPMGLKVFDGRLYWGDAAGVWSVPTGGGAAQKEIPLSFANVVNVAVDATGIYFATYGYTDVTLFHGATPLSTTPNGRDVRIATTPSAVYWTVAWQANAPAPPDRESVRKLCKR